MVESPEKLLGVEGGAMSWSLSLSPNAEEASPRGTDNRESVEDIVEYKVVLFPSIWVLVIVDEWEERIIQSLYLCPYSASVKNCDLKG